ncbi:hypothetical protein ACUY3K_06495 [Corynebacterium uberis]|uniref:hypothetical protein n=1 Tax=Corynebacterium TaxID=1716 RepID=UPI001D0B5311|nr:hypothetical protein LH391_01085 [Corynebacterium uberis]UDL77044.1 hypothetical protein LH393_08325 [Corynebacterium uberis]UDL79255.1 hypothetical protein LH394_08310 [Corynebacterium uberis]UDL81460.1 hypothetical protein LH392_08735 [Corynebacterium uberis]UDL83671.1 hypothetical protein LH395_08315 [Corynebacterium uberis]
MDIKISKKREGIEHPFYLVGYFLTLLLERYDVGCQHRDRFLDRVRTGYHHRLFGKNLENPINQWTLVTAGALVDPRSHPGLSLPGLLFVGPP